MRTSRIRRVGNVGAVRISLAALAAFYMWLVRATTRWETHGSEIPSGFWERQEPFLLAVWHGRLFMVAPHWPRRHSIAAVISNHRDGDLFTSSIAWYGAGAVRGSSRRDGGARALRETLRRLRDGTCVAFTPDGPRGPRMRASPGVVTAARLSGAAVVPFAFATARRRILRSWDRFHLPLPLGRGVVVWGTPLHVPRKASDEELAAWRLRIEAALSAVTDAADHLVGQAAVAPAAVAEPAE